MDRGAWWATVHGVTELDMTERLSAHTHGRSHPHYPYQRYFTNQIISNITLSLLKSENVSHSILSNSVTPWTVAHQIPLSVGFPRQEYWNVLPFPSSRDLSKPRIEPEPESLMSPALAGSSLPLTPPGKPLLTYKYK